MRPYGSRTLVVSALVFYSLSSSKLPSYALVSVPGLAVAVGLWLDDEWEAPQILRRSWILCGSLLAGVGVALLTAHLWIGKIVQPRQVFGGNRPPGMDTGVVLMPVTVAMGCLLLLGAITLSVSRRPALRTLTIGIVGASVPVVALLSGAPMLREMYPWEAFGNRIEHRYGPVWLMGRRAPSLTFYAHEHVHVAPNVQALEREVRRQPHCWLVVTSEEWAQLSANLGVDGAVVERQGRMVLVRIAPSR